MATIEVEATTNIGRPLALVRSQFADVEHHAATNVHRGVDFAVIEINQDRILYRQTTRVGPARLRQVFEVPRTSDGPLVNTITSGQFTGGSITFTFTPDGPDRAMVHARFQAPATFLQTLAARLLRANVRRALNRALAEDKHDLESGTYSPRVTS